MRTNNRATAEIFANIAADLIPESEFITRAKAFNERRSEIEESLNTFGETLDYQRKEIMMKTFYCYRYHHCCRAWLTYR